MNKMNKLIALLDELYGFRDKLGNSVLRKIGHVYDEKKNVYITTLEYRTRRSSGGIVTKRRIKENSLLNSLLK